MAQISDDKNSSFKSVPNHDPPDSFKEEALTKCKSELDLVKRKSNLFLNKSYSFIDKTSNKIQSVNKQFLGKSELANLTELSSKMTSKSVTGTDANASANATNDETSLLLRKKSINGEKQQRPRSLPASSSVSVNSVKRESFLRQSFQSIRRSFTKKQPSSSVVLGGGCVLSSSSSGGSERTNGESDFEVVEVNEGNVRTRSNLGDLKEEEDDSRMSRSTSDRAKAMAANGSTSSVSTLSYSAPGSPMAPLQGHSETQSVNCLSNIGKNNSNLYATEPISSSTIPFKTASKGDNKLLRQSQSTPLPLVSSSANLRSQSPHSKVTIVSKNDVPEKEKKGKEVSSSRLKKFHRHFTQVSKDERVINYFSCALVSDILLQGHLYITDHHFAFYSNVFGYVTKVVIPTASVTRISKEKVAKIIPNAVGVATADERHVFGSFLSRESAYRLMCSVCPTETPSAPLIPKALPDVEISEECSLEDDSSCSISGNESPPQPATAGRSSGAPSDPNQTLLRRTNVGKGTRSDSPNAKNATTGTLTAQPTTGPNKTSSSATSSKIQPPYSSSTNSCASSNTSLPSAAKTTVGGVAGGPSSTIITSTSSTSSASSLGNGQTTSTSSSPNTVVSSPSSAFKAFTQSIIVHLKFPTEFNLVYVGMVLAIILAMFSGFLLYKISQIEAKTDLYRSTPVEFNWGTGNDEEVFAEALRWQKESQTRTIEETRKILHTNLQEIDRVRRNLEDLSKLIRDKIISSESLASIAEENVDRDDTD